MSFFFPIDLLVQHNNYAILHPAKLLIVYNTVLGLEGKFEMHATCVRNIIQRRCGPCLRVLSIIYIYHMGSFDTNDK